MKLNEIRTQWSGAPISEIDMARVILKNLECDTGVDFDLIGKAQELISATKAFRIALVNSEIELG